MEKIVKIVDETGIDKMEINLYTDTWYNNKILYNDKLTDTKLLLKNDNYKQETIQKYFT